LTETFEVAADEVAGTVVDTDGRGVDAPVVVIRGADA
jgi:hypothetical protein